MTPELIAAVASATVAIIGALTALVIAVTRLNSRVQETHELVNSRMTELLELTRASSLAEGKLNAADKPLRNPPDPPAA